MSFLRELMHATCLAAAWYALSIDAETALAQSDAAPKPQAEAPAITDVNAAAPSAAAAAATLGSTQTPQQTPGASRSEQLTTALTDYAQASNALRTWTGVTELIIGGSSVMTGVLIARNDEGHWGKTRSSAGLSGTVLAIGGVLLGSALYHWIADDPAQRRLARWDALQPAARRDPIQIARFEGELASDADNSAALRLESLPLGIGFAVGGASLIGLTAAHSFDRDARTFAYVLGGCYAGLGVLHAVSSLVSRSLAEKAWHRYTLGAGASERALQLHLQPRLL